MIFNNMMWMSVNQVWRMVLASVRYWLVLSSEEHREKLAAFSDSLEKLIPRLQLIQSG